MVAERNPQVKQAVVRLRELSADERARDLFERREKARRDQASREKWAMQQGAEGERAKWHGVVAEKDAALATKDAENKQLLEQIAALQVQLTEKKPMSTG